MDAIDKAIQKLYMLGCTDIIHNSFGIIYNTKGIKKLMLLSNIDGKLHELDVDFDNQRITTHFIVTANGNRLNGLYVVNSGNIIPKGTNRMALGYNILNYEDMTKNRKKVIICRSGNDIVLVNYKGRQFRYNIRGYRGDGEFTIERRKVLNYILMETSVPIYHRDSILSVDDELDNIEIIRSVDQYNAYISDIIDRRYRSV